MSSDPTYKWFTAYAGLTADSNGLIWFSASVFDEIFAALEKRTELTAQALFSAGGVITPGSTSLASGVVTVTGPRYGITMDGLAPLLVDPLGAGLDIDLTVDGAAFADGTHLIVMVATAQTAATNFDTPARAVLDSSDGSYVSTASSENIDHNVTQYLGALALRESTTTPASNEVPVATVDLATGTWSNLAQVDTKPILRDADVVPAAVTGSRPATTDIPAGAVLAFFDTTLGIPIWFDGTNWVDATGSTV